MDRPKDEARKTHSENYKIFHGKWPGEEKQFFLSYDVNGNTLPRTSTEGTTKLGCSLSPSEVIIKKRALESWDRHRCSSLRIGRSNVKTQHKNNSK